MDYDNTKALPRVPFRRKDLLPLLFSWECQRWTVLGCQSPVGMALLGSHLASGPMSFSESLRKTSQQGGTKAQYSHPRNSEHLQRVIPASETPCIIWGNGGHGTTVHISADSVPLPLLLLALIPKSLPSDLLNANLHLRICFPEKAADFAFLKSPCPPVLKHCICYLSDGLCLPLHTLPSSSQSLR